MTESILLQNGILVDGTGGVPRKEDVLIAGDRIAAIGSIKSSLDVRTIDCTGLTVCPGFIDAHSHSDLQVLENRSEKVLQGVTTEVVGNCGFSTYPLPPDLKLLHDFANGILCGNEQWGWKSAADYLGEVQSRVSVANVLSLVGHGSLRIAHAGNWSGQLPPAALDAMKTGLDEALSQGAAGLSTGLMYFPGSSAPFEELERLCRVVARHEKIHTSHIRSYTFSLLEAVDEQIELARRTGCRTQVSHLQAVGPDNWDKQALAIEKIEQARNSGVDIGFDCYPYIAGSTVLTQLLPQWALEGGVDTMIARFANRSERPRIASETMAGLAQRWTDLYISAIGSEVRRNLVGKSLAQLAELRGCEPVEAVMDLLAEERGVVNILEFNQTEENLRELLTHPLSGIVSDGFYVKGRPHPRLYGTFPFLLGEICRNRRWLPLEEAVRKITGLAAARFGIRERGLLAPGYFADLAVIDAETVFSPASYDHPDAAPVGVRYVFRNGHNIVSAIK